jgi:SET domain-containing protein
MTFELRASKIHGVGVFAVKRIKKGDHLPLFESDDFRFITPAKVSKTGIPIKLFRKYSIQFPDGFSSPKNFNRMSIGWYLNHSEKPNSFCDEHYEYFSQRDIKKDEEITINYNEL